MPMGRLRLVGSLKLQVSFAEYRLFYRALLQKRPIISRSLLIVATPYQVRASTLLRRGCREIAEMYVCLASSIRSRNICDMTHSHVWHDSSTCESRVSHIQHLLLRGCRDSEYVCHDSLICGKDIYLYACPPHVSQESTAKVNSVCCCAAVETVNMCAMTLWYVEKTYICMPVLLDFAAAGL